MKKEIGKILIDLGKLAFAGLVLAGLIRQDISLWLLIGAGAFTTMTTIGIGLYMIWEDEKRQKEQ